MNLTKHKINKIKQSNYIRSYFFRTIFFYKTKFLQNQILDPLDKL